MRFLVVSYAFLPQLGGQETATLALAEELARRGHQVDVVTATPDGAKPDLPFAVHHRPRPWLLLALHRRADAVIHNGLSLRFFWPLLIHRRPWLAIHIGEFRAGTLRSWAIGRAVNIAISQAVADTIPAPSIVIPNAYRESVFTSRNGGVRQYAFGFVGRLVSDKGCDNLLQALGLLAGKGMQPRCAIIGAGPEEAALKAQARALKIDRQIDFLGPRRDGDLASALNDLACLVVPSIWNEPFGIVALEGIACGCVVIGSQGGGLKDAIGACGLTYPNGDVEGLAAAMRRVLDEPALSGALRANAPAHLMRHTPRAVVDAYIDALVADR